MKILFGKIKHWYFHKNWFDNWHFFIHRSAVQRTLNKLFIIEYKVILLASILILYPNWDKDSVFGKE